MLLGSKSKKTTAALLEGLVRVRMRVNELVDEKMAPVTGARKGTCENGGRVTGVRRGVVDTFTCRTVMEGIVLMTVLPTI